MNRRQVLSDCVYGASILASVGLGGFANADGVTRQSSGLFPLDPPRLDQSGMKPLILIHDGAIEEFMAILLAASLPQFHLESVIIQNADCIGFNAAQLSAKLLTKLSGNLAASPMPPCRLSGARTWNPFPWGYRAEGSFANDLPEMAIIPAMPVKGVRASVMKRFILNLAVRKGPVTILNLCPLTVVAEMFQAAENDGTGEQLANSIDEIVWMGGAFDVAGNVDPTIISSNAEGQSVPALNTNAEWNAFSDPDAADDVAMACDRADLPLTIMPLDATNQTLLTQDILDDYFPLSSPYPAVKFARSMYDLVGVATNQYEYSFWDTLTTAYLGAPWLFALDSGQAVRVDRAFDPIAGVWQRPETAGATRSRSGGSAQIVRGFVAGYGQQAFLDYYVRQLSQLAWS